MGEPLSEEAFEELLATEIPKMPPMTADELGQAYDELRAEGMLEGVAREDFMARADLTIEVPPELRERILERARQLGSQGIREVTTYDIVDAEGPE